MKPAFTLAGLSGLWLAACASAPAAFEPPAPAMESEAAAADAVAAAPEGPEENEWGGETPQPLPSGEVGAAPLGEIS